MKKCSFIALIIFALWNPSQAQQISFDTTSTPSRPVYRIVQEQPRFPGGMKQLMNYITKNLHYPESARKANKEGRVFVTFIVNEQGVIENVKILKSLGTDLDLEAIRLIKNMPNWLPAKREGKAVACRYNLPINFSLEE